MDQMQKEAFAAAGVDIDSALERCLGNEVLLCRFYAKFLEDPNYAKLQTALAARDPAGAVQAAHTLKGVCGNLSSQTLFNNASEITNLLREDKAEEAKAKLPELQKNYRELTEILREYSQ